MAQMWYLHGFRQRKARLYPHASAGRIRESAESLASLSRLGIAHPSLGNMHFRLCINGRWLPCVPQTALEQKARSFRKRRWTQPRPCRRNIKENRQSGSFQATRLAPPEVTASISSSLHCVRQNRFGKSFRSKTSPSLG